jgi:hypothetical protein
MSSTCRFFDGHELALRQPSVVKGLSRSRNSFDVLPLELDEPLARTRPSTPQSELKFGRVCTITQHKSRLLHFQQEVTVPSNVKRVIWLGTAVFGALRVRERFVTNSNIPS